jgi:hypothetical protein
MSQKLKHRARTFGEQVALDVLKRRGTHGLEQAHLPGADIPFLESLQLRFRTNVTPTWPDSCMRFLRNGLKPDS